MKRMLQVMGFGCAASIALGATPGCLAEEDLDSAGGAVHDESLDELESESEEQALASCVSQPHGDWYCQAECNDYWASVTYRSRSDGTRAAGTRVYFSGGVSGYNETRVWDSTYHGVLDRTSGELVWPNDPPPEHVIIFDGTEKDADTPPPRQGHTVEVKAGPFLDPAVVRCRVR
jgi:hypothetical protein